MDQIEIDLRATNLNGRDTDTIIVKANKNKVNPRSTQSTGEKPSEIFNTLDYINKADRKLYRINPNAGKDSNFLNRFGVLPFNPAAVEREEFLFLSSHHLNQNQEQQLKETAINFFLKLLAVVELKLILD